MAEQSMPISPCTYFSKLEIFQIPPSLAFELNWKRFVNTKNTIDSNVELDRHL